MLHVTCSESRLRIQRTHHFWMLSRDPELALVTVLYLTIYPQRYAHNAKLESRVEVRKGHCAQIYFVFLLSHLNQHIKKEKQDGGDISPYVLAVSEVENMLEVGEVQCIL